MIDTWVYSLPVTVPLLAFHRQLIYISYPVCQDLARGDLSLDWCELWILLIWWKKRRDRIPYNEEHLHSFSISVLLSPLVPSHFFILLILSILFPSFPLLPSGLKGLPDSWFHWHVFANNRPANTDHSILCCPNISDCFHIRLESLETPQHFLFMVAINYSPWYELQSRKAKLETVAHFDREIKMDRDRQREKERQMNR